MNTNEIYEKLNKVRIAWDLLDKPSDANDALYEAFMYGVLAGNEDAELLQHAQETVPAYEATL